MSGKKGLCAGLAAFAFSAAAATQVSASFHEWRISEVYSDASEQAQFVELSVGNDDGEHLLAGHSIASTSNTFTFLTDLPSALTANKSFLVGTAAYAALPGAVAPDYVVPAPFFSTGGDTIDYAGVDTFNFGAGQLPTDGTTSRNADGSTGTNSPTNFAGQVGSVEAPPAVPLPPAAVMGLIGLGSLGFARFWRRGR